MGSFGLCSQPCFAGGFLKERSLDLVTPRQVRLSLSSAWHPARNSNSSLNFLEVSRSPSACREALPCLGVYFLLYEAMI